MTDVCDPTPLLRIRGLSKSFPGVKALSAVDLDLRSGEILAIVGHNGSGKSTLVKVLAGVHRPDPGATIELRGLGGQLRGLTSERNELHFVHQDLGLVDALNAVENLDLGRPLGRRGIRPLRVASEARQARELIGRFGASFDVLLPVGMLSPAERAIVAIARAIDGWTQADNVLVLDEPTAALHGDEAAIVFEAVRRIARAGAGVVFISHRLDEVLGLADRVVALRDGRVVADEAADRLDHETMVELIAGRAVARLEVSRPPGAGQPALEARGLSGGDVEGLDLTVIGGEIVGVSGILGSGREQLASLLFGALRRTEGTVAVAGRRLPPGDMASAIDAGMAFVPADRTRRGAVMDLSVRENLTLARLRSLRRRFGRIDRRSEREEVARWTAAVDLRPPDPERSLKLLSGGNQQKVVLAKWLRIQPRVLLLDEPTQGVDAGAKSVIYELLLAAAEAGCAVVICSSDTKELVLLCDRVLVLEAGRLATEVLRESLSELGLVRAQLARQSSRRAAGATPA
jgi:ABC-type sugar transport system ATPase subunit